MRGTNICSHVLSIFNILSHLTFTVNLQNGWNLSYCRWGNYGSGKATQGYPTSKWQGSDLHPGLWLQNLFLPWEFQWQTLHSNKENVKALGSCIWCSCSTWKLKNQADRQEVQGRLAIEAKVRRNRSMWEWTSGQDMEAILRSGPKTWALGRLDLKLQLRGNETCRVKIKKYLC